MSAAARALLAEFETELPATRRVLERVPAERYGWKPHPRSLSAGQLAQHVAGIPGNVARLAQLPGFDVAKAPPGYAAAESRDALLTSLDHSASALQALLGGLDEAGANGPWRLSFGDRTVTEWTRLVMIRTMGLNHWYHHRGELVVYLRLMEVPVPIVYGRSADESPFPQPTA